MFKALMRMFTRKLINANTPDWQKGFTSAHMDMISVALYRSGSVVEHVISGQRFKVITHNSYNCATGGYGYVLAKEPIKPFEPAVYFCPFDILESSDYVKVTS